ncbi:hypothetical protein M2405_000901 [Rhodococcus erythropolis]|nr:hypothetical protein [Rhodococcus erythropolis]MCW2426136.1 hypothetical protein [Rhodococcus erythropolis]
MPNTVELVEVYLAAWSGDRGLTLADAIPRT